MLLTLAKHDMSKRVENYTRFSTKFCCLGLLLPQSIGNWQPTRYGFDVEAKDHRSTFYTGDLVGTDELPFHDIL